MSREEVREIQLESLVHFARWCRANDLRFQLAFGTLLGAVRHGGFIPWDDDIDLAMPRSDYERFCRTFPANPPATLVMGSLVSRPGWPLPFAKVWDDRTIVEEHSHLALKAGVGLDVFPIDSVHSHGIRRAIRFWLTRATRALQALGSARPREGRIRAKAFLLALAGPVVRLIGAHHFASARDRVASQYLGQASHSSVLVGPYLWSAPTPGVIETTDLPFEGLALPAPADPGAVLGAIYGDYMTPPAASHQTTHHLMTSLWID
jgi:lipopolysaccharide cholinephosphotransferase